MRLIQITGQTDDAVSIDQTGRDDLGRNDPVVGRDLNLSGGADGFDLAVDELRATDCDSIGVAAGEAYEMGLEQSVAFANFIRLADERTGGSIRYEIISMGNSDPLMPYPVSAAGVTAGAWNRIAAANNRVEISLFPDNL